MKTGSEGSRAILRWGLTLCEVVLVVASLLIVYVFFRGFSPTHNICIDDLKWYCTFAVAFYVIFSLYTSPIAMRISVRTDEIMQRCFRRVAMLFALMCAALTFVRGLIIAHYFLVAFSVALLALLLIEELLSRYLIMRIRFRKKDMDSGKEWDILVLPLSEEPLVSPGNRFVKRLFDICVSLLFLLTLFPIVYIVVFCVTKMQRRGSVLVTLSCCGMNGKVISCVIFRCGSNGIKMMPLFFNVLVGNMSIVGSVLCSGLLSEEYRHLSEESIVHYRAKPGITSWNRVVGSSGADNRIENSVKNDIWYVENWTFWLDIYVILKTLLTRSKSNIFI